MASEKHEQVVAELCTVHRSIEKSIKALISAKRICEQEENHSSPSDRKIGKLRVEIRANESKLADLLKLQCQLAQEELAGRYVESQQNLEQQQIARAKLSEQEEVLSSQLAAVQEKIAKMDGPPEWRLTELTRQAARIIAGPLKRELEANLGVAQAALNQARQQMSELEGRLEEIRGEIPKSATREAALKAELQRLLAQGESHFRMLGPGSLAEIRVAASDFRVTINRQGLEELLQRWERGFTELMGGTAYGSDPKRFLTFRVEYGAVFYWADTGELADDVVFEAKAGSEVWPKQFEAVLFDVNLVRERLELKRAAAEAQPVAV